MINYVEKMIEKIKEVFMIDYVEKMIEKIVDLPTDNDLKRDKLDSLLTDIISCNIAYEYKQRAIIIIKTAKEEL